MRLVIDELRKHRSFREVWIGYLLGGTFLFISMWQAIPFATDWFMIQQDIYTYGATLTAFLIVIGLSRLFCYETECRTDSVVGTSNNGSFLTWKSKVTATVIYCATVVFLIGALSLIIGSARIDFEDAWMPVSKCFYFESVPLSNLLYCVVQYIFLFLGALYFAGFVLIVALLTRRTALTIFLCGGTYLTLLGYYYVGRFWNIGSVLGRIFSAIFRFSFCGFMLQEGYIWNAFTIGSLGDWEQIWKSILLVTFFVIIEFAVLWILWRRKARK